MRNGGPAFPQLLNWAEASSNRGMTLRDWFAGQALVGMMADSELRADGQSKDEFPTDEDYAAWAYEAADAMLEEREK